MILLDRNYNLQMVSSKANSTVRNVAVIWNIKNKSSRIDVRRTENCILCFIHVRLTTLLVLYN